jgi:type II secretory pathway pseudopilin PulG
VETAIAMLVLAILALAGGAGLYHARAEQANQRHKRVALELANSRMEEIHAKAIRPTPPDGALHYVRLNNVLSDTDPQEQVTLNSRAFPVIATVQYEDTDGDGAITLYDCVRIAVTVRYRKAATDVVMLESKGGPP